ncbi:MAG: pentapeptide repeat-containing protein [Bacteroidia bacterium]|nr:pentapeptide repeat-containing protein [Bacteroidia bacterium]
MPLEHQKEWLRRYKAFHPEAELTLTEAGLDELAKGNTRGVEKLVDQPILLHMVATSGIDLDKATNRAAIYKQLFDRLIERLVKRDWDTGRVHGLEKMKEKDLRKLLQEIALAIFQSPYEYINESEFLHNPASKQFLVALERKNLQDSLKNVLVAFYFQAVEMEGSGPAAYEFLHKSLQEYLTAEKIWATFLRLTSQDEEDEFSIRDARAAMELLSPILAPKSLSVEIRNFLLEIISNEDTTKNKGIFDRLSSFIEDFEQNDYLLRYEYGSGFPEPAPLEKITNLAYVIIAVLSQIRRTLISENPPAMPPISSNTILTTATIHPLPLVFAGGEGVGLRGADLRGADLSQADLSQADLSHASLSLADLSLASLSLATLSLATLRNAFLIGADLRGAVLRDADLLNAYLSGANLSGADLRGADLSGADLRGADLRGADLRGADLRGVDLRVADLSAADLRGADLTKCFSLFKAKGLPGKIRKSLEASHPHLFEEPKPK